MQNIPIPQQPMYPTLCKTVKNMQNPAAPSGVESIKSDMRDQPSKGPIRNMLHKSQSKDNTLWNTLNMMSFLLMIGLLQMVVYPRKATYPMDAVNMMKSG